MVAGYGLATRGRHAKEERVTETAQTTCELPGIGLFLIFDLVMGWREVLGRCVSCDPFRHIAYIIAHLMSKTA